MDWTGFPSLNSLRAFAALAEAGSYSRAGGRLNVSHAAVYHQVQSLETRLGVKLVIREGRGIKLTSEGTALARQLSKGFSIMRDGIEALTKAESVRRLEVTTSPAFAANWLMPRLPDFQRRHPDITLVLNPTAQVIEIEAGRPDLAIRFGSGQWPDVVATLLLLPDMVVVGARRLIGEQEHPALLTLSELPWLQELGTDEVAEWMKRHSITPKRQPRITHMPGNLIMEAVRRGDGVTYTARCFVDREIQSGQLVVLSSENGTNGYYIVTQRGTLRPQARAFRKWIKHQAAVASHNDA
jgi:LysR family glycine cleavage system transcriptional activator